MCATAPNSMWEDPRFDPTPVRTVAYSSISCMLARVLLFRTNGSRFMAYTWLILGMAGAVAVLTAGQVFLRWRRFRGVRVVTCPETCRPVAVRLEAARAARTGLMGTPELWLSACSRWPEKAGCGQECVSQIAEAPDVCLVRTIAAEWYRGKSCVYCQRPFGEIEWSGQKPALLSADKATVDWNQVPAEQLPDILQTASPVCFACHMANTLV